VTAPGAVEYRRLPGRGRTPLGSDSLWIGEDHLLLVELRGFTETYRRFYFRDVQAIILRRTDRAGRVAVLLGVLGLVFLGFAADAGPVWNVVWGGVSGLLFLGLAVNVALGPSCSCVLRTALQTVRLRPLGRLRRARRVLERLRTHIELEQGTLTPDDRLARAREAADQEGFTPAAAPSATAPPVAARPPIAGRERTTRHDTGRAHEALAYALLFSAVAGVVPVLYFHVVLSVALSVVFLGRMACLVAALARQHHSDLPASIRTFAWTAFGFEVAIVTLGIVTGVVMVFKMLESGALTPLAIIERVRSNSLYKVSAFLSSLGWLTLGVWGLLLHRRLASTRGNTWQTLPT